MISITHPYNQPTVRRWGSPGPCWLRPAQASCSLQSILASYLNFHALCWPETGIYASTLCRVSSLSHTRAPHSGCGAQQCPAVAGLELAGTSHVWPRAALTTPRRESHVCVNSFLSLTSRKGKIKYVAE